MEPGSRSRHYQFGQKKPGYEVEVLCGVLAVWPKEHDSLLKTGEDLLIKRLFIRIVEAACQALLLSCFGSQGEALQQLHPFSNSIGEILWQGLNMRLPLCDVWLPSDSIIPKVHRCSIPGCGKVFMLKHHLYFHEQFVLHNGVALKPRSEEYYKMINYYRDRGPYPCRLGCEDRNFATHRGRLSHEHSLLHTPDKPFLCTVVGCSLRFVRHDGLLRHLATYRHDRPTDEASGALVVQDGGKTKRVFVCKECEKEFDRAGKTERHQLAVHGVISQTARRIGKTGNFACSSTGCERKFTRPDTLARHIDEQHSGPKERLPCPDSGCPTTFGTDNNRKAHVRKFHPELVPAKKAKKAKK
ncbi:hypothetical protein BJ508DRAFT_41 [Ascobolus immersus RN42]|uniref:C2H2-type domain-containing protein n=1 Tax=Ascobolus immersus RN42 TaxID=1160509 RepID=A0A3N4INY6_ASCIM|nr:hypothetical protein BJ508DRAFT_41 [Ascobolus immersus RN42]